MSEYIEKKILKLKLLTPVHITDGYAGELIPTEYVITDNGQLHKIDLARLISQIPDNKLDQFNKLLDKESIIEIRNFIKLLWKENQEIFSDVIEYSMTAGDLHEYYNNLQNENKAGQFIVAPFIRSGRKIFIPGSSLKGAIRTAFINELAKDQIDFKLNAPDINKKSQILEADTLYYSYPDRNNKNRIKVNATKDPFKALKIGDVSIPPDSNGINSIVKKIEIVQKTDAGKFDVTQMEDMKIFAEVLRRGVEANAEIRLDSRFFSDPKSIGRKISLDEVVNSCKAFYKKVLVHERDKFFSQFDKQVGKSQISDMYDEFLKLNESPESFLLRIGKHSGRNSLSFNLCNKKGVEPKSRKLIKESNEYWPLGWLCATLVNRISPFQVRYFRMPGQMPISDRP